MILHHVWHSKGKEKGPPRRVSDMILRITRRFFFFVYWYVGRPIHQKGLFLGQNNTDKLFFEIELRKKFST